MACLLLESFDYYATAQLPALWDSATSVVIDEDGGRLLGGAALFDASVPSALTKALTWGDDVAVLGFAVRFEELATTVTLATLETTLATIRLQVASNGVMFVTINEVVQPCESSQNQIVAGIGAYVELRIDLNGGAGSIETRVNEQRTGLTALSPLGDAFVSLTLGGGSLAPEVGTFLIDDVYLLDGVPASSFQLGPHTIDNASFLGSTHVEALYATQEGLNIGSDPGYTPWTPDPGPTHYAMVNEHPPNDGATNESSSTIGTYASNMLDVYATYGFVHPSEGVNGFGLQPISLLPWALFAVQWIGRVATNGTNGVKATIREDDDLPSTDIVAVSSAFPLASAVYAYKRSIYDRDPIATITSDPLTWWTFAAVFLQAELFPGREFGITLSS